MIGESGNRKDKNYRGSASQFFVAGELCRRGHAAVVTMGNTPNTDILCSNVEGTKFVHIQVKTFIPGSRTCTVGVKAEKNFGENFFWVLGGIPTQPDDTHFEYYVIPSSIMAENVTRQHQEWLNSLGAKGQKRVDNTVRTVHLPPFDKGWNIKTYFNNWDLIGQKLMHCNPTIIKPATCNLQLATQN